MDKITPFRLWLHQIWLDNCDEHDGFGELPYTKAEYWNRFKWWLKREYRHQMSRAPKQPYQMPANTLRFSDVSEH